MQFRKLRLSGFKSFVDHSDFLIEPGMTGIVGPNGCGKSNLVESLRWVMGETSAKQLRGGEMDDVIFNGTSDRPARNLAEVSIQLDNSARKAPAQFNDTDILEVARRIERGQGSTYKVNGREVRARDVQILFADAVSGARSTALVSQGHIGDIVNAKPQARRHLLEEAAGISGLHSRRHEAELRLNAADTNLGRVNDMLVALEEQLKTLKKQARQATRYRNLSDHIRRAEAMLYHTRWLDLTAERDAARLRLTEAEKQVADTTTKVARISADQASQAADVPGLRQAEAEAAAALQRLLVARDALEQEEARIAAARQAIAARISQIDEDSTREAARLNDAREAEGRLTAEGATLRAAQADEAAEVERSAAAVAEIATEVQALESDLTGRAVRLAADEARETALTRRIDELTLRINRLTARREEIERERAAAAAELAEESRQADAHAAIDAARVRLNDATVQLARAETEAAARTADEAAARDAAQAADKVMSTLNAEIAAVAALVELGDPDLWPPLIDALHVEPGYEKALSAALGDELTASADEAAPAHWRNLPPLANPAPLPAGVEPLARFVTGPPALARRLSQIGVVPDAQAGRTLHEQLAQGQRLVTRDGALWRWDGYMASAGAATATEARLAQRNRLTALRADLGDVESAASAAREAHGRAQTAQRETAAAERAAREAAHAAELAVREAREADAVLAERMNRARARAQAANEMAENLSAELTESTAALDATRGERDGLADLADRQRDIAERRAVLDQRRGVLAARRSRHDALAREVETRRLRLETIANDLTAWRERASDAERQIQQLAGRRQAAAGEEEELATRPAEIARRRGELFGHIEIAEQARSKAADVLAAAETRLTETGRALKAVEARLADEREERVRREGDVARVDQNLTTLAERVAERLQCAPEGALAAAGIESDEQLPDRATIEARVERLIRERDTMGPVNLRAEAEADELEQRIASMQSERDDLTAAINRLRQGIASLNKEGRERLVDSFKKVDENFRMLFVRLFGGGHAHLTLTDTDDPLEAGLEIMASPPGKRLQTLSLLSGGEQALTAISLLFAVFITNPAPICVLDEVDAPLDDHNVERFCNLVSEIANETSTRFLLITHHRHTMARVDRLFGVTMPERGVSQLVSVDLQTAERLRATA